MSRPESSLRSSSILMITAPNLTKEARLIAFLLLILMSSALFQSFLMRNKRSLFLRCSHARRVS